jgi:predicted metal-dependent phosphoesterase TrpH
MKEFRADLHIHTLLSPCADLEMTPRNIVAKAMRANLISLVLPIIIPQKMPSL